MAPLGKNFFSGEFSILIFFNGTKLFPHKWREIDSCQHGVENDQPKT